MSAPLNTAVRERVEGTRRILESDGWELTIGEEFETDEPLIADEVVARHLGIEVESVRRLIRRHAAPQTPDTASGVSGAPNITPVPYIRSVRRTTRSGQNRGEITVSGFMLTEADALFVVTRSDSARAVSITKKMIAVYMAVRRHLATSVAVEAHTRSLPSRKALPVPAAPGLTSRLTPAQTATLRAAAKKAGLPVEDFVDRSVEQWIRSLAAQIKHPSKHRTAFMGYIRTAVVPITEGLYEAVEEKALAVCGEVDPESVCIATHALLEMGAHTQSIYGIARLGENRV
jgi:hypothetical protein